jgi:Ca2+-binding RTX toxin-like protein
MRCEAVVTLSAALCHPIRHRALEAIMALGFFFHPPDYTGAVPPGYTPATLVLGTYNFGGTDDDHFLAATDYTIYSGEAGNDILDYALATSGILMDKGEGGVWTASTQIGSFRQMEEFRATDFADTLAAHPDTFKFLARGGNDLLIAGANAETLDGGADNDTVSYANSAAGVTADLGLSGPQVSAGTASGDTLTDIENVRGSAFADVLTGDAGDNILNDGGFGSNDTLTGGDGNDSYSVYNAGAVIVEVAGEGSDRVSAGVDYVLASGISAEYLNTTSLHATYAVNLTGNEIGQLVRGNDGANVLDGAGGNDWLFGMGGADVFSFSTTLGAGNVDQIADFSVADDQIQLDSAIFTALGIGALDASAFKDNFLGSRDADDRIIYNSDTGSLFYDADGSGADFAAIKFASLASGLGLGAADFTVI